MEMVESDAVNVVTAVSNATGLCDGEAEADLIVQDIKEYLSLVPDVFCQHISANGNMVAHLLAQIAWSCLCKEF